MEKREAKLALVGSSGHAKVTLSSVGAECPSGHERSAKGDGGRLIEFLATARAAAKPILMTGESKDYMHEAMSISEVEQTKNFVSDDDITRYRTVNGHPLKGLLVCTGGIGIILDFDNLPNDRIIPEVIELQRNYLYYKLIVPVVSTLEEAFNLAATQ